MHFEKRQLYHVFNQGNNRQKIFFSDGDYSTFINYTKALILPNADIIAYCLMPNHFHFLLHAKDCCADLIRQGGLILDLLTNGFRKLLSSYTRVFNAKYKRSGSLFRQKTKAKRLTENHNRSLDSYSCEEYCCNCFHYIHENPVVANLVQDPADWKWSSYKFYAELEDNELCNMELAKKFCGYDPKNLRRNFNPEVLKNLEID